MKLLRKLPSPRILLRPQERLLEWLLGIRFNGDLEQAAKEAARLLHDAHGDVRIVAGRLERGLFSHVTVLPEFKEAIKRGADIRLICDPDPEEGYAALFELAGQSEGKFQIRKAPSYPPTHYIVVDRKDVLLEERHPPGSPKRHGITYIGQPELGRQLTAEFDAYWASLDGSQNQRP